MNFALILVLTLIFVPIIYIGDSLQCYRLGDIVRGKIWKPHRILFSHKYPTNSLAYKYMQRTSLPSNMRVLNEIVPTTLFSTGLVVHLRIGDVIENVSHSVEDFLAGDVTSDVTRQPLSHHKMGNLTWQGTVTGAGTQGYVKSAAYYDGVIQSYPRDGICQVTVIGGTHKNVPMVKSLQYVQAIRAMFEARGFTVVERISTCPSIASADADFTVMANATVFVPSGGGFSGLAAELVRLRGNCVYKE
jgi:hypothetical protein